MTYYSKNRYTGNGATTNRILTFDFFSRSHVKVYLNGVDSVFSWVNDSEIQISPAPANGVQIEIKRETPKTERLIDWQDGSGLTESDMDTADLQVLYIAQEAFDTATDALSISIEEANAWNAANKRIVNVADAVDDGDAVNKAQVVNLTTAALAAVEAAADAAAASEAAAATSETNAAASEDAASASASAADTSETNAAASASAASTSASNASASASTAGTQASNASASASAAATSETNAGNSASSASSSAASASTSASTATTQASNASTSASNAATSASNAATSETNAAASAAKLTGTSTSSVAIGTGSKGFTTQSGKDFATGRHVLITSDADPANRRMSGIVTAYTGTSLTVTVEATTGAGTFSDWTIRIDGERGQTGATGSPGSIPIATAGGTANAITADYSPDIALTNLTLCAFVSSGPNSTTTPTFAPDGLTARTITKNGGAALVNGDTGPAGYVCLVEYNSANTRWELLNPAKTGVADITGTLGPANGGTGVANNAASTITISGNFASTFTVSGVTSVTFPTSGTLATLAGTETFTNKRLTPRVQSVSSSGTVTANADTNDIVVVTAQAAALNLANPSGTPVQGQGLIIRIKDNGTARAITYGSQFRGFGSGLPSTTVINKTLYLSCVYNSTDTKWDVTGAVQET